MKKSGIVILVCAILSSLYAYDYQTVFSNRTALFQLTNGIITALKIDSVPFDADSIFFPFKSIQKKDEVCYDAEGSSWSGNKIIVSPEWNYFFNEHSDTMKIKTNAKFHEGWKFFENEDVIVEAVVYFHDTMTVLGLVDSVKTIDLQAYYKTEPTGMFAHGVLLLSKHYGLIKTYNLHVFPGKYQPVSGTTNLKTHTLVGMNQPILGMQNLNWFDVFDFQPGEEFHTEEHVSIITSGPPTENIFRNIRLIQNREDFTDSIVYQIHDRNERIYTYGQNVMSHEFSDTESKIVITQNHNFDLLPSQPYIQNEMLMSNYMEFNGGIIRKRSGGGIPYNESRACWTYDSDVISDVCNTDKTEYYKGLGGPFYERTSGCWEINNSTETRTLMYYKKGSVEWGTPIVISGLDETSLGAYVFVYRNPVKDVLSVKFSNPVDNSHIKIYDLSGSVLLHKQLFSAETEIQLSSLVFGMYMYQICVNGQVVKSGKIGKW